MEKKLLTLIIITLFLAEILILQNQTLGFILYSILILGTFLAISKSEKINNYFKILLILMTLPILRISQLFINFSVFWNTAVIYFLFFFLTCFYIFKFKINPGFTKKYLYLLPLTILLGIILGFFSSQLAEKTPQILILLPIIAFSEEVLFRTIQVYLTKLYSPIAGILIPALLFTIFSSLGIISISLLISSIIIGIIYHYTKNIYLSISINFMINFLAFAV